MNVARYSDLAAEVVARPSDYTRLIAVDGPGGAGKSVFAGCFAAALGGAQIVHTDDFATGQAGAEWWPRLQAQVIVPLAEGRTARFQRYDWDSRSLAESLEVRPAPAVIIEGVSSARIVFADALTLAVWVHAPRAIRLARGLERDGEGARTAWGRWMAEEDQHFRRDATIARCEILVDGFPSIPHDPVHEFVLLACCSYD